MNRKLDVDIALLEKVFHGSRIFLRADSLMQNCTCLDLFLVWTNLKINRLTFATLFNLNFYATCIFSGSRVSSHITMSQNKGSLVVLWMIFSYITKHPLMETSHFVPFQISEYKNTTPSFTSVLYYIRTIKKPKIF